MATDIVSLTEIKAFLKITGTDDNALLQMIIDGLKVDFEMEAGCKLWKAARTEYFGLKRGQKYIVLASYPVDTGEDYSVYYDTDRTFGSTTELTEDTDFVLDSSRGRIIFLTEKSSGEKVIKVTYTGGLVADSTALAATYPNLERAAFQRVVYEYNTMKMSGKESVSIRGDVVTSNKAGKERLNWIKACRNFQRLL